MNLAGLDFIGKPRLCAPSMDHREQLVLEVPIKDDPSRLRRGQGAKNIALVRPFAINAANRQKKHQTAKTGRMGPARDASKHPQPNDRSAANNDGAT